MVVFSVWSEWRPNEGRASRAVGHDGLDQPGASIVQRRFSLAWSTLAQEFAGSKVLGGRAAGNSGG
jgi:hypothetical protein